MRKRTIWLLALSCAIIASALFLLKKYELVQMQNTVDIATLNDTKVICLDSLEYIELPSQIDDENALTVTGLSIDEINQTWFIGNYGKKQKDDTNFNPSIVNVTSDFSMINYVIPFNENQKVDIQGVAYDKTNSSLWYTDGENIINCNSNTGEEISRFSIGEYSKYKANGICIDPENDTVWVLCMYKYLLHYDKDGTLLDELICEYIGQDHIYMDTEGQIYISVGTDYQNENNYVICIDQEANIQKIYQVNGSYAIEGIVLIDDKLYVLNDGIYHESKIKKNYIQVYDIER